MTANAVIPRGQLPMRDIVLANPSVHLSLRHPSHSATVYKRCTYPQILSTVWYAITKLQGELRQGGIKYTGVGKFAIFDRSRRLSRKRYEIGPWLLCRKSQVADRSVSVPMTLSDFEKGARGVIFFWGISVNTLV